MIPLSKHCLQPPHRFLHRRPRASQIDAEEAAASLNAKFLATIEAELRLLRHCYQLLRIEEELGDLAVYGYKKLK